MRNIKRDSGSQQQQHQILFANINNSWEAANGQTPRKQRSIDKEHVLIPREGARERENSGFSRPVQQTRRPRPSSQHRRNRHASRTFPSGINTCMSSTKHHSHGSLPTGHTFQQRGDPGNCASNRDRALTTGTPSKSGRRFAKNFAALSCTENTTRQGRAGQGQGQGQGRARRDEERRKIKRSIRIEQKSEPKQRRLLRDPTPTQTQYILTSTSLPTIIRMLQVQ